MDKITAPPAPESISDRPLKYLFFFCGSLIGLAISAFLIQTFIVYLTFTDQHRTYLSRYALIVIVILTSAWLNRKLGVYIAAKINVRDSPKNVKTSIAWGVSIVSFLLYLSATGIIFSSIKVAPMAPNFNLQDMSGRTVMLSDYTGKVVVLDFWTAWAPPCRDAIPNIEKLHNTYKARGLVVLSVSFDLDEWDKVKATMSEYGITYIVLKGTANFANLYQVHTFPTILVIDKTGKIAKREIGSDYSEGELETDIKALL